MAMRSLGYMPSEVELAIIMQRLDMDGEPCLALPGWASHLIRWAWDLHESHTLLPVLGYMLGIETQT